MGKIQPITKQSGRVDLTLGCRVIDDFIAVVEQEDEYAALAKARQLMSEQPELEAAVAMRRSKTLEQSTEAMSETFFGMNFLGNSTNPFGLEEGRILFWPLQNQWMYREYRPVRYFGGECTQYKTWSEQEAETKLGPDYCQIFKAARYVFPELLSCSLRSRNSGHPGITHFDETNRPGLHNILDLPEDYVADTNAEKFQPLDGGITITMALGHGGTIVCKTPSNGKLAARIE